MAALDNQAYLDSGLYYKPEANMNNHFYMKNKDIDFDLLSHNLEMFKTINNL